MMTPLLFYLLLLVLSVRATNITSDHRASVCISSEQEGVTLVRRAFVWASDDVLSFYGLHDGRSNLSSEKTQPEWLNLNLHYSQSSGRVSAIFSAPTPASTSGHCSMVVSRFGSSRSDLLTLLNDGASEENGEACDLASVCLDRQQAVTDCECCIGKVDNPCPNCSKKFVFSWAGQSVASDDGVVIGTGDEAGNIDFELSVGGEGCDFVGLRYRNTNFVWQLLAPFFNVRVFSCTV